MRDPQKYLVHTTAADAVELISVETGECIDVPPMAARQIHCPRSDFDLFLNGVQQNPCDPSVVPDPSWYDDRDPEERVLAMRRAAASFAEHCGSLPATKDDPDAHEATARLVEALWRQGLKIVRR